MKTQCAADMKARLELNNEQLRAMQEQLGTLFQVIAVEESREKQKTGYIEECSSQAKYRHAVHKTILGLSFSYCLISSISSCFALAQNLFVPSGILFHSKPFSRNEGGRTRTGNWK
jgi:hypothetical protein